MTPGFNWADMLTALAGESPSIDMTLSEDGRISMRSEGRLVVQMMPMVKERWPLMRAGLGLSFEEGRSFVASDSKGMRYRLTGVRARSGESVTVRPLPETLPSSDYLLLPSHLTQFVSQLDGGLVLVVGPTGSGKSVTVASLLRDRARVRGGKYVTLEEPIEYIHESTETSLFLQREIGLHVSSYEEGLSQALRMNPDVIAVQELRERHAAEACLGAALSGHLVVASLHAFSAYQAPQRFLGLLDASMADMGAREALASCLEAVVYQRLLPGFGRLVPVFEILLLRSASGRLCAVENLVREGNWVGLRQEIEVGARHGMLLFADSFQQRVREGSLVSGWEGSL